MVAESLVFGNNTVSNWGTIYECFRVPSVVRVPGSPPVLVVFTESRIGSCGDQAPKDITMRRSVDGGRTWGPLTLVVGPKTHQPDPSTLRPDFTARNPYATVLRTGDILLNWVNSTDPRKAVSWQRASADGGISWTPDVPVGPAGLGPLDGTLMGPGAGIVLGMQSPGSPFAGRVVICGATGYVGSIGYQSTAVFTSDDNGKTWHAASGVGSWPKSPGYPVGNVTLPFRGLAECQLVELPNGSVMVNSRNEDRYGVQPPSHTHHRAVAVSHDGGRNFGPYYFDADLIEPTCSAGLINFGGILYFSNPASTTERAHMTVKRSLDLGASWTVEVQVDPGPSAYSVLVPVSDPKANGTEIGVLYEFGGYRGQKMVIIDVRH